MKRLAVAALLNHSLGQYQLKKCMNQADNTQQLKWLMIQQMYKRFLDSIQMRMRLMRLRDHIAFR